MLAVNISLEVYFTLTTSKVETKQYVKIVVAHIEYSNIWWFCQGGPRRVNLKGPFIPIQIASESVALASNGKRIWSFFSFAFVFAWRE